MSFLLTGPAPNCKIFSSIYHKNPKAISKSKHGRKAGSTGQAEKVSLSADSGISQTGAAMDAPSKGKSTQSCHASRSLNSAAIRDERRRDQALQNICNKASKHRALTLQQLPQVPSSVMAPDQISLRDCLISVSTTALWGSAVPSAPAPPPPLWRGLR